MSIGNIIKKNQPDVYKKLIKITNMSKPNKSNKSNKNSDDDLTFDDFERMMRHDSFKKVNGCIKQVGR